MMCARCDEPIKPGEEESYDILSPTGGGVTVHMHKRLCPKTPMPTAPDSETR